MGDGEKTVEIFPQPGFSSMKAHAAVLKVHSQGEYSRDTDEHITSEWVSRQQVKEMIKDGKIKDMGLLSAISVVENLS